MDLKKLENSFEMPLPCHKNWQEMEPKDQGRNCTSCDRVIMDFRDKDPKDVFTAWKDSGGKLCGVFNRDQVSRPHGRFGMARFLAACVAVFGAFLFSVSDAEAQEVKRLVTERASVERSIEKHVVRGYVRDQETMEPLMAAVVVLKGSTIGVCADLDGFFSLEIPSEHIETGKVTLVFRYVGYEDQEIEVKINPTRPSQIHLDVELDPNSYLGMVGIIIEHEMKSTDRNTNLEWNDDL